MGGERWALLGCVFLFTLIAAVCDWRLKKLPNKLTVPAFAMGLIFHLIVGAVQGGAPGALRHLGLSLGGFALGFGALYVLWLVGGGGGGDVKFMGALGAWLGPVLIFAVLVATVVFVAVSSIAVLALEASRLGIGGAQRRYLRLSQEHGKRRKKGSPQEQATRRRLVPFAVPVALATWTILAVSQLAGLEALSRLVSRS